ncbi:MAG: hypothetical protein J6R88_04930 [Clostridia bacterium]|nr:hypothetical protein [Clostridia bacterium]
MIKFKKFSSNRISKILLSVFIILIMTAIIIYPDRFIESALNGLKLWCFSVLPSLLPFFFLTALLTGLQIFCAVFSKFDKPMRKIFNLSGASFYAFFISVISGYPVGSRTVTDLYLANAISEGESKRASVLASTSGPLFIIGAIGTATFNNKFYGFILFAVHVASALLTALTFKNYGDKPFNKLQTLSFAKTDNLLYESVYSSVISVLMVGGFISIFYVLSDVLFYFNALTPLSYVFNLLLKPFTTLNLGEGFISGLIECTKGCHLLSKQGVTPLTLSLTSFLISFGGLSIIMQSLTYLNKCKIKSSFFILAKIIQGTYSFILSLIIFSFVL